MRYKYKIEAFKTVDGGFYWRLKGKNSRILATSEIYKSKDMCLKTVNKLGKALKCEVTFKDMREDFEY